MITKFALPILAVAALLMPAPTAKAITNLTIAVEGTNIVLSWPSTSVKTYLIQYRSSLDTNASWVNLTNNYPAAVATNVTRYVIEGVVQPPSGGSGGGGGAPPPPPSFASGGESFSFSLFGMWELEGRDPYVWEAEQRPPFPWEAAEWNKLMAPYALALQALSIEGGASLLSSSDEIGFFRVFQVPNWQPEFQGATLDGFTFVTVDYSDYADLILDSEILVDGQPTDFAERNTRTLSGTPYDGTDFYFDRLNNGSHQFQLLTTIRLDNVISETDHAPTLTFTSKVVNATIANVILFTNWEDSAIGPNTTFEAFSTIPNVDWTIDVYDVVNDFVISESGHSTDGKISWTWDLYDFAGMLRDDWGYDPIFQPVITIIPTGQITPAAGGPRPAPKKALDYPLLGQWLVVYQDREKRPGVRDEFLEAMGEIAGGPAFWDSLYDSLMLNYGPEYTQTQRKQTWIQFRNTLLQTPVRNFYYQGHGTPNSIGGDLDVTNKNGQITGSTVFPGVAPVNEITTDWVEKNLTKSNKNGYRHFRFVFLDGCETAKGKWPEAFGVPKTTNAVDYYTAPGRKPNSRPSAFVGWETVVGGSPEWGFASTYRQFRGNWMFRWALAFDDLDDSFATARNLSNWITLQTMNSSLRIYGLNSLGFQDYDSRGQWPGP